MVQADRLKNLRTAVRLDGGNAHFRENLEQPFVDGLDKLDLRGPCIDPLWQISLPLHVHQRLEHQVGVDRARAIADQTGEVVHIARLASLQDQADLGPGALTHKMVVHR